jgi:hypothetical protein
MLLRRYQCYRMEQENARSETLQLSKISGAYQKGLPRNIPSAEFGLVESLRRPLQADTELLRVSQFSNRILF